MSAVLQVCSRAARTGGGARFRGAERCWGIPRGSRDPVARAAAGKEASLASVSSFFVLGPGEGTRRGRDAAAFPVGPRLPRRGCTRVGPYLKRRPGGVPVQDRSASLKECSRKAGLQRMFIGAKEWFAGSGFGERSRHEH